jgi:hypothetical protein
MKFLIIATFVVVIKPGVTYNTKPTKEQVYIQANRITAFWNDIPYKLKGSKNNQYSCMFEVDHQLIMYADDLCSNIVEEVNSKL